MQIWETPECFAQELLISLCINEVPVPVEDICSKLGITLKFHANLECESVIAKKQQRL